MLGVINTCMKFELWVCSSSNVHYGWNVKTWEVFCIQTNLNMAHRETAWRSKMRAEWLLYNKAVDQSWSIGTHTEWRFFCVSLSFCFQSLETLKKFKIDDPKSVSVCVSLASDSSETIQVIITKLGMVTASDMLC